MDEHWNIYERSRLYAEIWEAPMRDVAGSYGVSGVALAKTCRKLSIPVPGRGYWAKLAAGKAEPRPPLPQLPEGAPDRLVARRAPPRPPAPPPLPGLEEAVPIVVSEPIVVAETLENAHRLVALSARYLQKAKPGEGLVSAPRSTCLDIAVSPSSLDRALRIADALLKGLQAAGLSVEVAPLEEERVEPPSYWQREVKPRPPLRVSRIACDGESIAFALRERIRKSADPRPPEGSGGSSRLYPRIYSYEPTGELALKLTNVYSDLGVRTTWKDGKHLPLERQLDEFVAYLSTVALAFKLKREDDERHRLAAIEAQRRHLEEEHRRWGEEERIRKEAERLKELEAEVARWRRAQDIRAYVEAALRALDGKPDSEEEQERRAELALLLEQAERIDPLS